MKLHQNTTELELAPNVKSIYLSSIGLIFLVAYLSCYVQYPGLSSAAGIEPSHRIVKHAYPNLHGYLIESNIMDTDSMCNLILIVGVVFSILASW